MVFWNWKYVCVDTVDSSLMDRCGRGSCGGLGLSVGRECGLIVEDCVVTIEIGLTLR